MEAATLRVQVGQLRLYNHDQLCNVTEIIRHPNFNMSWYGWDSADIALLKLEAPLTLSEDVNLVSLPSPSLIVPPGMLCWVTGWGDIADHSRYREKARKVWGWGGWALPESASLHRLLGPPGSGVMPGFGQEVSGTDLRSWALALARRPCVWFRALRSPRGLWPPGSEGTWGSSCHEGEKSRLAEFGDPPRSRAPLLLRQFPRGGCGSGPGGPDSGEGGLVQSLRCRPGPSVVHVGRCTGSALGPRVRAGSRGCSVHLATGRGGGASTTWKGHVWR